jgi:hypothetical protein
MKTRNSEPYSPRYAGGSSHPHGQSLAHSPAAPAQTTFYPMPSDQNKGPGHEYYPSNVMYNAVNYQHMSNVPHSTGSSRGQYNQ